MTDWACAQNVPFRTPKIEAKKYRRWLNFSSPVPAYKHVERAHLGLQLIIRTEVASSVPELMFFSFIFVCITCLRVWRISTGDWFSAKRLPAPDHKQTKTDKFYNTRGWILSSKKVFIFTLFVCLSVSLPLCLYIFVYNWIFLKLVVACWSEFSPSFMEAAGLPPYSQLLSTLSYPQPFQFSSHPCTVFS